MSPAGSSARQVPAALPRPAGPGDDLAGASQDARADRPSRSTTTPPKSPCSSSRRRSATTSSPARRSTTPSSARGPPVCGRAVRHARFALEIDPLYVEVALRRWERFSGRRRCGSMAEPPRSRPDSGCRVAAAPTSYSGIRCQRSGREASRVIAPFASRSSWTVFDHQPDFAPPGKRSSGRWGPTASRSWSWVRPGAVSGSTLSRASALHGTSWRQPSMSVPDGSRSRP